MEVAISFEKFRMGEKNRGRNFEGLSEVGRNF
jgi:hypothetical protein